MAWTIKQMKQTPFDFPLILLFFGAIGGLAIAVDKSLAWPSFFAIFSGFAWYFFLSRADLKLTILIIVSWLLMGSGVLLSGYFIIEYRSLGNALKLNLIGLIGNWLSAPFPQWKFFLIDPNSLGSYLDGIFFLSIGVVITENRKKLRILAKCCLILITMGIFLSASRGSWLSCLTALILWMVMKRETARTSIAAVLTLGCTISFYIFLVGSTSVNNVPFIGKILADLFVRPDRLEVYMNSLDLIRDMPLTGIGLGGQFPLIYSRYELIINVPFLYYSHHMFLESWLELGLIGAAWWSGLAITLIYEGFFVFKKKAPIFQPVLVGIIAIFIHGLSDARPFVDLWCWIPFFSLAGIYSSSRTEKYSPIKQKYIHSTFIAFAFFLLMISTLFLKGPAIKVNMATLLQQEADLGLNFTESERSMKRGEAAGLFLDALKIDPTNRTSLSRLGLIALENGKYLEAINYLERAFQIDPSHPGVRKTLGFAYLWEDKLDQASPLLIGVPNIVEELNYWGWYFGHKGVPGLGANAYELSLRFNPDQPEIIGYLEKLK